MNDYLKLVKPNIKYKDQIMNYKKEFIENNSSFDGCAGLEDCTTCEEWLDFDNRLSKKYEAGYVPSSTYLAVVNNKVVGMVDIRHYLTDHLKTYGGHIGYSVLPSKRRRGYAKEILRLALIKCKKMGINNVIITCLKDNIASAKTIKSQGGILENEMELIVNNKKEILQRYNIKL